MKKLFTTFFCIYFFLSPSFALNEAGKTLIEDDFVEKTLDKNLKITPKINPLITDDFAESNKNKNVPLKKKVIVYEKLPEVHTRFVKKSVFFEEELTPIKIRIKTHFSTKQKASEGDKIEFVTLENIDLSGKTYKKGTPVYARIENISKNNFRGTPADLVVGNFAIDKIPLYGEINKTGANRGIWIYPCGLALSWFFGLGFALGFIKGGNAKISPNESYVIYGK